MSLLWWPAPEAGEIVWCRFPYDKMHGPEPEPRPALVVRVYDDHKPRYYVHVAYGTSQNTDRLRSGEFGISRHDGAAWPVSGLSFATKFNFHKGAEIPYNATWFAPAPGTPFGQNPKLGLLHPCLMRKAQAAWNASRAGKRKR